MQEKLEALHKLLYSEKSKQYMFLALCTTVFVYGFMYRIIDLRTTFWCSIPFVLYHIFEDIKKNPFDISFILISTATLIIANIAYMREPWLNMMWSDVRLVFVLPMIYLLGNASVGNDRRKYAVRTCWGITALNFGMFFQAILDHINKFFEPRTDRTWYSFWKDDYEVSTVFDIGFIIMVSSLYYAFKERKKRKYLYRITIINVILCIVFSLESGGRTTVFMCAVMLLVLGGADVIYSFPNYSAQAKKRIVIILSIILIIALVGILMFTSNILGIHDLYMNSFLGRDGGILHNVRIQIAIQSLRDAINVPQGGWYGSELLRGGGSHNTWLEFARRYNTFVFVIMILYICFTLINCAKQIFSKDNIKYLVLGAVISMLIYMNMEPVGANPSYYYVIFFIFVSGIINKMC
ncbi:hypothetical protein SAMN04487830_1198 [Pseudobutyrivibrio sp. OR37]|uniref:hypothetical protein n=1 Tax=Pseudobutyrivibrio sp. OR37 TaxID=1798186 RepID=UPI0008EA7B3E|nr:hypothetical protein [Pseudobutyrivibrio sp. OR37]SFI04096.1 hypothetical protein SAMN04487830_1198 [Pseudobutyrivibrio sp. OR37]